MRLSIDVELDYHLPQRAAVLLALEAAQTPDQRLVSDKLIVGSDTPLTPIPAEEGIGRRTWTGGEGRFTARYEAVVDVEREAVDLATLHTVPLGAIPGPAVAYLWPSRYCESERMKPFALEQFGNYRGGAQVVQVAEWTRANLEYRPGCSDSSTTAHDTFHEKKGICRDFAHVMIGLTRALDIPARMVSAYAWDLSPPDFHAVVEVYLAGPGGDGAWYLVDPSGLAPVEGLVRIGVGRDATDISFMTIFGTANLNRQRVWVERSA
ncbi:MAG: transglutaminase family protein [Sphingosinicella sp.]|nr:transglutaminase family protein [Sphingosinicella sp.]